MQIILFSQHVRKLFYKRNENQIAFYNLSVCKIYRSLYIWCISHTPLETFSMEVHFTRLNHAPEKHFTTRSYVIFMGTYHTLILTVVCR